MTLHADCPCPNETEEHSLTTWTGFVDRVDVVKPLGTNRPDAFPKAVSLNRNTRPDNALPVPEFDNIDRIHRSQKGFRYAERVSTENRYSYIGASPSDLRFRFPAIKPGTRT